jgi:hypothetical protein
MVSGVVTDAVNAGHVIAGARVQLLTGDRSFVLTDARGAFTFNVAVGHVLVEITKAGYQVWETEVIVLDRDEQVSASLERTTP